MKKNAKTKSSKSAAPAKKSSASKKKPVKGKTANPAAMKNPPKKGGSVLETEPADIQEFKHRKKVAAQINEEEAKDKGIEGNGFDIAEKDQPEMIEDEDDNLLY